MPRRALLFCGLFTLLMLAAGSPPARGSLAAPAAQPGTVPGTLPGTVPGTLPGTLPGTVPGGPEAVVLAALAGWDGSAGPAAVEATLAHFAADAVYYVLGLPTGPETVGGKAALRGRLNALSEQHLRLRVEVLSVDAAGGDGTVVMLTEAWTDAARRAGIAPLVTLESYTVKDGLIREVVAVLTAESQAALEGAQP